MTLNDILSRDLSTIESIVSMLEEAIESNFDTRYCIHEITMRHNLDNRKTKALKDVVDNRKEFSNDAFYLEVKNITRLF